MIIPFQKLPDSIKSEAAAAMLAGKTWFHWGNQVDNPELDELRRWMPKAIGVVAIHGGNSATNCNKFVGIFGTDSASPAGNKSIGAMMRNADVSLERASVPHAKKRFLADCLISAKPNLSNRELARMGGLSHTYIANRRRVVQSGNKSL